MPEKFYIRFACGSRQVLTWEEMVLVFSGGAAVVDALKHGKEAVNWNNVCYIRPYVETDLFEE